jgi:hypothetical protein
MGRDHVTIRANVPSTHSIELLPEAVVHGQVRGSDGQPISSAAIWFGTRHRFDSSSTHSAHEGRFRLTGLPAGDVVIHAEVPGHGMIEFPMHLIPGEEQLLDIEMDAKPQIFGQLLSAEGEPLARHVVVAMTEGVPRMADSDTTTKAGDFRLLVESGVPYTVYAYPRGDLAGFPIVAVKGRVAGQDPLKLRVPDRDTGQ